MTTSESSANNVTKNGIEKNKRRSLKNRNPEWEYPDDNKILLVRKHMRTLRTFVDEILRRQKNICPKCEKKITRKDEINIDHIVPVGWMINNTKFSWWEINSFVNIQVLHKKCNQSKSDKMPPGEVCHDICSKIWEARSKK